MSIRDWLSNLFSPTRPQPSSVPEGWTTDMNIRLPDLVTYEHLVDFVIAAGRNQTPDDETERQLIENLGLGPDDAALARDRIYGGIVRAATKNVANRPDANDDPMAYLSFQRATDDNAIIVDIFPQYAAES